jgi:hypothetical protein
VKKAAEAAPAKPASGEPPQEDAPLPFAPPPLSPEDLAAVSTLPRFGSTLQRPSPPRAS